MKSSNEHTARNKKPKKTKRGLKFWLFRGFFATAAVLFLLMAGYLIILLNGDRMLKSNIGKLDMAEASIVYDANHKKLMQIGSENREIASLGEMPALLPKAFVATEDKRFYEHQGIDLYSIGRAVLTDIAHGSMVEGGSTITQQLAKNMFLSNEKTLFRKVREVSIAMALENNYGKSQILQMYLNRIYFGNGAYGVKAAAKKYFGVDDLKQLKLWQIATLAGIPKAPAYYNPLDDPKRSKERRAVVLELMHQQGLITQAQKTQAEKVDFAPKKTAGSQTFPSFADYVIAEAGKIAGLTDEDLRKGGYKIYTTLIPKAQESVEKAFSKDSLFPKGTGKDPVDGSMVIINNADAGIVAMAGGRNYTPGDLNKITVSRQPGSAFKPIAVYGPALETGNWTPDSLLDDQKTAFGNYHPGNYNDKYLGKVTMTYAVQQSINLPAVWLLNQIGVDEGIKFAGKLGIDLGPEDHNLSIALGGLTHGVTPLQMARAYSAFANGGVLHEAHAIAKIEDAGGKTIYTYHPQSKRVMSETTAWYMTQMLEQVISSGTGKSAQINRPAAGKTGTTQSAVKGVSNGNRDVWFAGYTPEWSAAIWMGYDKTTKGQYLTNGSSFPAKMFAAVFSQALAGSKARDFTKPSNLPDQQPPPQPVKDLTAAYNVQDKEILLQWTPSADKAEYRLFRQAPDETAFTMILQTTDHAVRDLMIAGPGIYRYYVVPVLPGTDQTGAKSNEADAEVPANDGLQPSPSPSGGPDQSGAPWPTGLPQPTDGQNSSPTPTPSETLSPQPTPTPSATSGLTPTPTPTPSASPGLTPTPTPAP